MGGSIDARTGSTRLACADRGSVGLGRRRGDLELRGVAGTRPVSEAVHRGRCVSPFPVGAVAALLWLPVGTTRQSGIRQVLDAIIVATSIIILAWVTLLERVFVRTGHSGLGAVVPLTYLMLGCVVVAVAILVFAAALPARASVSACSPGTGPDGNSRLVRHLHVVVGRR